MAFCLDPGLPWAGRIRSPPIATQRRALSLFIVQASKESSERNLVSQSSSKASSKREKRGNLRGSRFVSAELFFAARKDSRSEDRRLTPLPTQRRIARSNHSKRVQARARADVGEETKRPLRDGNTGATQFPSVSACRSREACAKAMRWRRLDAEEGPSARRGHTLVSVFSKSWDGELIVAFGGEEVLDDGCEATLLEDVLVFHVGSCKWFRPVEDPIEVVGPGPRAFHSCFLVGTSVYIVGGRKKDGPSADIWALDTNNWHWTIVSEGKNGEPSAREASALAVSTDESCVVLHGGSNGSKCLGDTHVLHLESGKWNELCMSGSCPSPRSHHTISIINDHIVLFGGRGLKGNALNDLWILKEFKSGKGTRWTKLDIPGTSPSPRWGHAAVSTATAVIYVGGRGDTGWITKKEVYFDNVVAISRTGVQWVHAVGLTGPNPCMGHSAVLLRSTNQVLLVGGFDGDKTLNQAWLLEEDIHVSAAQHTSFGSPRQRSHEHKGNNMWRTLGEIGHGILNNAQLGSPVSSHGETEYLEAPLTTSGLDMVNPTVFPSEHMAKLRREVGLVQAVRPRQACHGSSRGDLDALDLKRIEKTLRKRIGDIKINELAALMEHYKQMVQSAGATGASTNPKVARFYHIEVKELVLGDLEEFLGAFRSYYDSVELYPM